MDHAMAAVDQPFVPQAHEHFPYRAGVGRVEGEARAAPVAGAADDLELFEDRAARLAHERPYPLHERLAAQVESRFAFVGKLFLDHVLRRDTGVVGPGQPFGRPASHPLEPDDYVLDDVVEPVTDVKHGRDVGRWDDDDIRLGVGTWLEDSRLEPALVDGRFYGPRIVCHSLI